MYFQRFIQANKLIEHKKGSHILVIHILLFKVDNLRNKFGGVGMVYYQIQRSIQAKKWEDIFGIFPQAHLKTQKFLK